MCLKRSLALPCLNLRHLPQQQKTPGVSVKSGMTLQSSWRPRSSRQLRARPFTLEPGQTFAPPRIPPAHLRKGSTQLTRGFSRPNCFFGFCFSKTAAVAEREEFASFLPSLPSASIFPKGKKKKIIIPEPAACFPSLSIQPRTGRATAA